MRRVLLGLAVVALVGLAADTAFGGGRHRGDRGSRGYYGAPAYGYSYGYGYGYGYYSGHGAYGQSSLSFPAAVARIRAKYSNYRYNPHPRSNYKSGPALYGYRRW